jgi:hypothetical protein
MRRVTADSTTLMRQAWMTAEDYLHYAIEGIDKYLGDGYAKRHPELIAAYMRTAAADFQAGVIAGAIEDVSGSIEGFAEAIEGLDFGKED